MESLSHLVPALSGHASMNGTNMVSVHPDGDLPGTTSEATANVKLGDPSLDIPAEFVAENHLSSPSPYVPETPSFSASPTCDESFTGHAQSAFEQVHGTESE
jgi:hypothetical protein